eukprot:Rhum_TRINITY_DN1523_c0_g1::Rhum_TRINITY_DN1523_c0_g1_i1::g.4409::m.4409
MGERDRGDEKQQSPLPTPLSFPFSFFSCPRSLALSHITSHNEPSRRHSLRVSPRRPRRLRSARDPGLPRVLAGHAEVAVVVLDQVHRVTVADARLPHNVRVAHHHPVEHHPPLRDVVCRRPPRRRLRLPDRLLLLVRRAHRRVVRRHGPRREPIPLVRLLVEEQLKQHTVSRPLPQGLPAHLRDHRRLAEQPLLRAAPARLRFAAPLLDLRAVPHLHLDALCPRHRLQVRHLLRVRLVQVPPQPRRPLRRVGVATRHAGRQAVAALPREALPQRVPALLEQPHDARVLVLARQVHGAVPGLVRQACVGTRCQQQLDHLPVPVPGREVQGRHACVRRCGLRVRPRRQQPPDLARVPARGGAAHQRRPRLGALPRRVAASAALARTGLDVDVPGVAVVGVARGNDTIEKQHVSTLVRVLHRRRVLHKAVRARQRHRGRQVVRHPRVLQHVAHPGQQLALVLLRRQARHGHAAEPLAAEADEASLHLHAEDAFDAVVCALPPVHAVDGAHEAVAVREELHRSLARVV